MSADHTINDHGVDDHGVDDQSLDSALKALAALHPKKIDLGLSRINRVLETLGNPQDRLPPVVHIAGTNGKGSTTAFLRAMAEAGGLTCHVYTSPHLVHFRERIVVSSKEISDPQLVDVLSRVRAANDGAPLSFFEATTAAAILAFSETAADLCILEVGLGGRYDATNVIDKPAIIGITPIDYDHAEFLGRDIAGIAREKAGIMKHFVPAAIGRQRELVTAVLEAQANKLSVNAKYFGQDFRSYRQHGRLVYEDESALLDLPLPALTGEHQIDNAGLAINMARRLQFTAKAIEDGLTAVRWPARIQKLTHSPLAETLKTAGGELWLDGGHNPHAARAVASAMAEMESQRSRPLILITGILANKDIGGFLDAFEGLASAVIGLAIPGHASLAPETLRELAQNRGLISEVASGPQDAIQRALKIAEALPNQAQVSPHKSTAPRVLICGSLYLAGEVLRLSETAAQP